MRDVLVVAMSLMAVACANGDGKDADAGAGSGATGATGGSGGSGGSGGTSGVGGTSGLGGSGGVGGAAGGGGVPDVPECQDDEDCVLGGGCCDCWAVPMGEERGTCRADCEQDLCAAHRIEVATCNRGRCVLPASCNRDQAQCDAPTPQCPTGQTALVLFGCYGACVDVVDCLQVTGCADCGSEHVCIEQCRGAVECVEAPTSCGGTEGCACLADRCEQPTFCFDWDASEQKLSCGCDF